MKIAVDAMGGDYAPEAIVEGAVLAAEEYGLSIILTGPEDRVKQELAKYPSASYLDIEIKHASQIVEMRDEPAAILRRKKDSSLHAAIHLVRDGEADAAVSAGNTGAGMAIALMAYRPLEGIDRPGLATVMPNISGAMVLMDVGANVDCKPVHLLQFAVMGHVYAKELLHIENPRVGLMSTGEEASKGNAVTKETFEPLSHSKLNFLGNAEGRDIFNGRFDVIICDGFVGNVVLKASEGLARTVAQILKEGFTLSWRTKLAALLAKPAIAHFKKRTDYQEYGGAPLLGLNKIAVISHGSSKAFAMKNAIRVARESVELQIQEKIAQTLTECEFDVKSRKKATSFWRQLGKSIRHEGEKEKGPVEKHEESAALEPETVVDEAIQTGDDRLSDSSPHAPEPDKHSWWHLRESRSSEKPKDESHKKAEPLKPVEDVASAPPHTEEKFDHDIEVEEEHLPEGGPKKRAWWSRPHREQNREKPFEELEHADPASPPAVADDSTTPEKSEHQQKA